jgi:hypothetical protein
VAPSSSRLLRAQLLTSELLRPELLGPELLGPQLLLELQPRVLGSGTRPPRALLHAEHQVVDLDATH